MSEIDINRVFDAIDAVSGFRRDEAFDSSVRSFAEELASWGGRIHLTGREDIELNLARQLADSLEMLVLAESVAGIGGRDGGVPDVADIGSGAGFPGIVWSIARTSWMMALFERKKKPAAFLERTVSLLGLENAEVVPSDLRGAGYERSFDIAVSKAAGRLDTILPLVRRVLRASGAYITVKGKGWEGEIGRMGGSLELIARKELPEGRGEVIAFRRGRFT
mgnify:CR=1 FL=1